MKFEYKSLYIPHEESPPSRGAWIEISAGLPSPRRLSVAPLAGGVD